MTDLEYAVLCDWFDMIDTTNTVDISVDLFGMLFFFYYINIIATSLFHGLGQQGICVPFGHPNPQNSHLGTPKYGSI